MRIDHDGCSAHCCPVVYYSIGSNIALDTRAVPPQGWHARRVVLTGDVDPYDELWAELCEMHVPMRLAGHHASDDLQLRDEDEAALDQIPSLRMRYNALADTDSPSRADTACLEFLDEMLCSLEGRAEIYRLMVSTPQHRPG